MHALLQVGRGRGRGPAPHRCLLGSVLRVHDTQPGVLQYNG